MGEEVGLGGESMAWYERGGVELFAGKVDLFDMNNLYATLILGLSRQLKLLLVIFVYQTLTTLHK